MLLKIIIIILMLTILYSLGSALYYLVQGKEEATHVVKALSWRIGLSLFLFLLIMVAYFLGWLVPNSI